MKGTRALLAHLSSQTRPDNIQGEPILIETSEKQLEELVITLDVGRAHAQLRRLKTENMAGQDLPLIVTAIPEHKSKVLFECLKMTESTGVDSIGYIMFECGLEGVGVKIVKRSHFEKSENTKEELAEMAENGAVADGVLNELVSQNATANTDATATSKAEAAWRLITKKPPTPKTPKEKFQIALESIIVPDRNEHASSSTGGNENRKSTPKPGGNEEDADKSKNGAQNPEQFDGKKETDKTSSCVIELKSVWFNFAAPPCVPITRKIDLTR